MQPTKLLSKSLLGLFFIFYAMAISGCATSIVWEQERALPHSLSYDENFEFKTYLKDGKVGSDGMLAFPGDFIFISDTNKVEKSPADLNLSQSSGPIHGWIY